MQFGAIFDWDGVIVDSREHHDRSWRMLADEVGKPLPWDHFKRGFGMKNEEIIPAILGWTDDVLEIRRLSLRKEAMYRELLVTHGQNLLAGVRPFLEMLREHGVPCAIGSSTHRLNIEAALELTNTGPFFADMVTSEDVARGKPDPQVFLLAAGRIRTPPGRCIVFEDVPAGIRAAHAGGMKAVALTTTHPAAHLGEAELVIDRLDQVSWEALVGLLN